MESPKTTVVSNCSPGLLFNLGKMSEKHLPRSCIIIITNHLIHYCSNGYSDVPYTECDLTTISLDLTTISFYIITNYIKNLCVSLI